MDKCCINLTNEQDKFPINEPKLEQIGCKMLDFLKLKPEIINLSKLNSYDLNNINLGMGIFLCDDNKIKELNKAYRKKDKATDILSFALFADSFEDKIIINNEIFLGEIIISVETAKRQADENGKSLEDELYFLLSHGILHLFGFDHNDEESFKYMLEIQEQLTKMCT